MRKFVITALVLLAVALGLYYANYEAGFYLPKEGDVSISFRAEGNAIEHLSEEGWTRLEIRGVELTSSLPGHYTTDYAPTRVDYTRWMGQILDMGANTVYAPGIMDDDFYNALWDINQQETLYLIQGVTVEDELNNRTETAYAGGLMDALIQNGKTAADVIHGRRDIASGGVGGSGRYRKDVSSVVIGYLIGSGWEEDTIAYTDHMESWGPVYSGIYYSSAGEASPTERMAAQIMDEITQYETRKYLTLRPAGIMTEPDIDFLRYEEVYARQLGKYAFLDPNHISTGTENAAGQFTGYTLYNYCEDLARCLSQEQKDLFSVQLQITDKTEPYGGLLSLLPAYDEMPVVGFYSCSSARGTVDGGRLTEQEQGEFLVRISALFEKYQWAGGTVSAWQDGWTRRSWNTAYAADTSESYLWHDIQTAAKNTGLLAFEPGENSACVIDGDKSEWTQKDRIIDGAHPLSVRQDATGIYLLIENTTREQRVYVPIDVSPEVGSKSCEIGGLEFEREADFLLIVDGQDDTRLLVQERYDPVRQNFLYQMTVEDPFINIPQKDSSRFVPLQLPMENRTLLDVFKAGSTVHLDTVETGKLVHGCGNPDAEEYLSLTDFCFGADFVEVRIPWLLLNFGDPAHLRVHRDYYERYGVELLAIRGIWLGTGTGETAEAEAATMEAATTEATEAMTMEAATTEAAEAKDLTEGAAAEITMRSDTSSDGLIRMNFCRLRGWSSDEPFRERLKESYFVLRNYWTDNETDEGAGR